MNWNSIQSWNGSRRARKLCRRWRTVRAITWREFSLEVSWESRFWSGNMKSPSPETIKDPDSFQDKWPLLEKFYSNTRRNEPRSEFAVVIYRGNNGYTKIRNRSRCSRAERLDKLNCCCPKPFVIAISHETRLRFLFLSLMRPDIKTKSAIRYLRSVGTRTA